MDMQGQRSRLSLMLVSLTLTIGGCVTAPALPARSAADEEPRATQLTQEREKELAALRADMASTRIAAAKQEAELHELRATVVQLRQENGDRHQALLEAKRLLDARETEVAAMKTERDQLAQTSGQSSFQERQLTALQDTVTSLSQELAELKSAMTLVAQTSVGSNEHGDVVAKAQTGRSSRNQRAMSSVSREETAERIIPAVQILREGPDQSKPSWITVQPGESWWSLARKHHTTMKALRAINGRVGDHLIVGETIRLP